MCNKTALEIVREAKGIGEVKTSRSSDDLHELTCHRFVYNWVEEVLRELGVSVLKVVPAKCEFLHSVNDLTLKGWSRAHGSYTVARFDDDNRSVMLGLYRATEAAKDGDLELAEKVLAEDLALDLHRLSYSHPLFKDLYNKLPKNPTNPHVSAFVAAWKAIAEREAEEEASLQQRLAKFRETFGVLETLMKDVNPDIELQVEVRRDDSIYSLDDEFDVDESFDVDVIYTPNGNRIYSFIDADLIEYDLPVEECVAAILDEHSLLIESLLVGAAKHQQEKVDQQYLLQTWIEAGLVSQRGE